MCVCVGYVSPLPHYGRLRGRGDSLSFFGLQARLHRHISLSPAAPAHLVLMGAVAFARIGAVFSGWALPVVLLRAVAFASSVVVSFQMWWSRRYFLVWMVAGDLDVAFQECYTNPKVLDGLPPCPVFTYPLSLSCPRGLPLGLCNPCLS